MMNVAVKEYLQPEPIKDQGTFWRTFSKIEISNFSQLTGDTNSIHLTENPVVQGLFILKKLCDTTEKQLPNFKYQIPVKYVSNCYLVSGTW